MKPLNPVMAALLAASSAAFALPGISYATTPPAAPPSAPVKPVTACSADEKNPINALACLIAQKPAVRAEIGARLAEFVQGKDASDRRYLTDALQADKVVLPGVVAVAQKWPEANKDKPGTVAVLYFVVGPSAGTPAWAQSTVLAKTLKPGMMWASRLADALAYRHWTDTKQIPQSGAEEAIKGFLNDAAEQAQKVFDDPRTKKDIQLSIGANDVTAPEVPTTSGEKRPSSGLDTTGSGYGFADLYETGAVVGQVFGPKDEGYRKLSMKVFSANEGGVIVNKLAIFDITQPDPSSPSLPQFVDTSKAGDTDVVMRDGGRHYTVTVGLDGSVSMRRANVKEGEGGTLSTSKSELLAKRNDQIVNSGTVMIGGMPYYALGQGGPSGSILFFPQSEMTGPKANAHPALMGDVAKVAGNGDTVAANGDVPLGTLRDGSAWHLAFDVKKGLWVVTPGAVKAPDAPAGSPAGSPAVPPAGSTPTVPSPDPATPTPVVTAPTAPAKTLEEAIANATADKDDKTTVWVEDPGNAGLDADVLAQLRIMSNVRSDKMTHFKVLFDASLGVKDNAFEFQAINKDIRLLHVRGVKKFVALQYATGTQYYDVKNFANYVQHVYDSSLAYEQAGSFAVSNGQMQDVKSMDIVEDVLTQYLKVKPGDAMITTVRARIKEHAKDAGFIVNGDTKTLYLGVGEVGRTIWPDDVVAGDTGNNEKMTGLRGPGTAVDVTGGEPGEFKKEMDMGSGRTAVLVQTENRAAIYLSSEEETYKSATSTVKVWSVMLEYKNDNGLNSRSKALPVFGSGHNRYMLPKGIHMQGLPELKLPASTQLMMQYGSDQENGAIAAYRYVLPDAQGGQNARDKKGNCAGPVLWWGSVTKEQAQAACEGDSKIK